jgi:hypothetical protein
MFDTDIAFRQWLISETTITDLVPAEHIRAGDLPQGANPGAGERWITFRPMPGPGHPEIRDYVEQVVHVVFWAPKDKNLQVREAYRALRDLVYAVIMKAVSEATIMCAEEVLSLQDVSDSSAEWAMGITDIQVKMRSNSPFQVVVPTATPGLQASGRHFPVEALNGTRMSFTFVGLPADPNKYLLFYNGQALGSGFTQLGEVITFDTITPDAASNDELVCYY